MTAHPHAPDPRWDALLADSDVDDAFAEWQAREDRRADHAPFNEQHPGPVPAEVLCNDPRRSSQ